MPQARRPGLRPIHRNRHNSQLRGAAGEKSGGHRIRARGDCRRETQLRGQRHRQHHLLRRRHEGRAHRRIHRRARTSRRDDHRPAARRNARGRGQRDSKRPPGTHRLRQLQPGDTSARPRPHGQPLPRGGSAARRHVPTHPPR